MGWFISNADSLCDFLWGLPAVGYRAGQKPQQSGPHVTCLQFNMKHISNKKHNGVNVANCS